MKISLLTINIISCVIFFGTTNNKATAQDTSHLYGKDVKRLPNNNAVVQKKLTSAYAMIPGGNYAYYNSTNSHASDLRAGTYVSHTDATLTPAMRNASSPGNHTASSLIQAAPDGNSGLHLQLTNAANVYAQTGFYFIISASDKYLESEDAVQIDGPDAAVFLSSYSSDGVNLCINTMSDYAGGKKVRLYVNGASGGQYVLSMADFNEIDTAAYNLLLIDNQQKDSTDLVHHTYTFNINTSDTSSFGAYRFVLSVQHKPVSPYALSSFAGQKVPTGVQLNWSAVNAGNYTGYTVQKSDAGGSFADSLYFVQSDNGTDDYNFTDLHPVIGNNVYRLKQNGINGAITYSANVTVGYNSGTPGISLNLYPNPVKMMMNSSLGSGTISPVAYVAYIYNSMGSLVKHEAVTQTTWSDDVSAYKAGVYFILVKDNNGNIIAQSKFLKAE